MKLIVYLLFMSFILVIAGCGEDFVETDITDNKVTLLAPKNGLKTSVLTHNFTWNKVQGAREYSIQIVSGSFSSISGFQLDSIITDTSYSFTLPLGKYQWRVKGMNGEYQTAFTTYDLTLSNDTSTDITNQTIVLESPAHNMISNQLDVTFLWTDNPFVEEYRFEVASPDFNGTQTVAPKILTTNTYQHTFTQEGVYSWRVRGENQTSNTLFTTYTFELDTTRPGAPTLLTPANNTITTDSLISFTWDRVTDTGSELYDSLFVYSDSLLTNLYMETKATGTNYQDTLSAGDYYWGVKTYDEAGNGSNMSTVFKVTIN